MSLRGFLAQFPPWLRRGTPLWIAVGVPSTVIIVAALFTADAEPRVRYAGLLLELLGVITVALGLRDTRKRFAKPSFLATLWAERPRWRKDINIIAGTGNLTISGGRADLVGTSHLPPDATLAQRVTMLETKMDNLHTAFHASRRRVEDELEKQTTAQKQEQVDRAQEDASIRRLIDEAVAGGLTLEAMGLFWLIIGVVLATASQEISTLFASVR